MIKCVQTPYVLVFILFQQRLQVVIINQHTFVAHDASEV